MPTREQMERDPYLRSLRDEYADKLRQLFAAPEPAPSLTFPVPDCTRPDPHECGVMACCLDGCIDDDPPDDPQYRAR